MEALDYILFYGQEIMYVLVGISVLILAIAGAMACFRATQLLRKVNRLANFLEKHTEKPRKALLMLDDTLSKFL